MNTHAPSPRLLRPAVAGAAAALLLALLAAPSAEAGIFREMFAKVSGNSSKPPVTANGETPVFPRQGYLCCNLHYDGDDWVSDSNYATLPMMLKAGTPVTVTGYGRDRVNIDVNGMPMRLGHEYGVKQEGLDAWAHKLVVDADPRPRITGAPAAIQAAIRAGKVATGMTRQQVLLSVGYPPTNLTASIDAPMWTMWASRRTEYQIHFGGDGRVTSITGDGEVTREVIYLPGRPDAAH